MWSLADFRFDDGIEADEVLLFGEDGSDVVGRDEAIARAHARGLNLITWWPGRDNPVPSCVVAKVAVPVRWERIPGGDHADQPDELDERLWFEADCGGRDLIGGNGHTFRGRLVAWCPHHRTWYHVSRDTMGVMPDETRYFVAGFLAGAEPECPSDADGDTDAADHVAWLSAIRRFRRTGKWYGRWSTCEVCGCVLLPDSANTRCHEHQQSDPHAETTDH